MALSGIFEAFQRMASKCVQNLDLAIPAAIFYEWMDTLVIMFQNQWMVYQIYQKMQGHHIKELVTFVVALILRSIVN